jgi:hypothetical protein
VLTRYVRKSFILENRVWSCIHGMCRALEVQYRVTCYAILPPHEVREDYKLVKQHIQMVDWFHRCSLFVDVSNTFSDRHHKRNDPYVFFLLRRLSFSS